MPFLPIPPRRTVPGWWCWGDNTSGDMHLTASLQESSSALAGIFVPASTRSCPFYITSSPSCWCGCRGLISHPICSRAPCSPWDWHRQQAPCSPTSSVPSPICTCENRTKNRRICKSSLTFFLNRCILKSVRITIFRK